MSEKSRWLDLSKKLHFSCEEMKIVKLRVFYGGFCCGIWFLLGIYFVGVGPVTLSINLWYKLDYVCHNMLFQNREKLCYRNSFPPNSNPKGHGSSDLRDGNIKIWNTLLILLWFDILAEFCSKHEEDYSTIWFFVEGTLSLCQSWT